MMFQLNCEGTGTSLAKTCEAGETEEAWGGKRLPCSKTWEDSRVVEACGRAREAQMRQVAS